MSGMSYIKTRIMTVCWNCGIPAKVGTNCSICKAPITKRKAEIMLSTCLGCGEKSPEGTKCPWCGCDP
jgi:hypothetical protein